MAHQEGRERTGAVSGEGEFKSKGGKALAWSLGVQPVRAEKEKRERSLKGVVRR